MPDSARDKKFQTLWSNYDWLEDQGHRLQRDGLKIAKAGADGKRLVEFLEGEQPKYASIDADDPNADLNVERIYDWADLSIKDTEYAMGELEVARESVGTTFEAVQISLSTTTSGGTSVIGDVFTYAAQQPDRRVAETYGLADPSSFIVDTDGSEIDRLLAEIDPQLVSHRHGAWAAFYSVAEDRLTQAANSMRKVLNSLISEYASNDQVKACHWWEPAPSAEAKNEVSVAQRLRLLMYGPTYEADDSAEIRLIDEEIARQKRHRKILDKVAHGSTSSSSKAVEVALRGIESLVLLILRRRASSYRSIGEQ
jgi:hypothetical protein